MRRLTLDLLSLAAGFVAGVLSLAAVGLGC